jgi:hypothetical protein
MLLEWVPEGLNTGALSSVKASSPRIRDRLPGPGKNIGTLVDNLEVDKTL